VTFYMTGPPGAAEAGVTMEYVELRRVGGRLFAVGRLPEGVGDEWASRLESGVAWDSVVHYVVFESREDLQRRLGPAKPGFLARLTGSAG
jgi:hypothetical protein